MFPDSFSYLYHLIFSLFEISSQKGQKSIDILQHFLGMFVEFL